MTPALFVAAMVIYRDEWEARAEVDDFTGFWPAGGNSKRTPKSNVGSAIERHLHRVTELLRERIDE